MNIIQGENSSGKSTSLKSIIYALGYEIILGKRGTQSLVSALTDILEFKDEKYVVRDSFVELEITNYEGKKITIRRQIIGEKDNKLIEVSYGHKLTEPAEYPIDYFFIHDKGAAQRKKGFHKFLDDFLDLKLPKVQTYELRKVPLYYECVFPLFFVEQKSGWADIQATIPKQYGIRDIKRITIEYLLGLDIHTNEEKRRLLRQKMDESRNEWNLTKDLMSNLSLSVGGFLYNFPAKIPDEFSVEKLPSIAFKVEENQFIHLHEKIRVLEKKIRDNKLIVEPDNSNKEYQAELKLLNVELNKMNLSLKKTRFDYFQEKENKQIIEDRLRSLKQDLVKNQDILKLQEYGAKETHFPIEECPTCKQAINDTLLDPKLQVTPLRIDINIRYIEQQINTAKLLLQTSSESLDQINSLLKDRENKVKDIQKRIKDIKTNLINPNSLPNISKIRETVKQEEEMEKLIEINKEFKETHDRFNKVVKTHYILKRDIANLPKGFFSDDDRMKLKTLEKFFVNNVINFGFKSSFQPIIEISFDDYLPRFTQFQSSDQYSASDNIRKIWAYTLALVEISLNLNTNHPGLCFFDEPGQHNIANTALEQFYKKILAIDSEEIQVFVATSEKKDFLENFLSKYQDRRIKSLFIEEKLLIPLN